MCESRRNLAKTTKKSGVSLEGRSCTGDEVAMRSALFSSFVHAVSTDEDPHHHHCPAVAAGTNSWCFYQRAVANGEEPGSHRENVHSTGS